MSLTTANTIIQLTQPTLFPTPTQIQGFASDDMFDTDALRIVETLMGVDGVLSAGFVFTAVGMRLTLQADSASNAFFDTINAQQYAAEDVYPLNGVVLSPALGKKLILTNGFLTNWKPFADAKRVYQPRRYELTFQKTLPAPA